MGGSPAADAGAIPRRTSGQILLRLVRAETKEEAVVAAAGVSFSTRNNNNNSWILGGLTPAAAADLRIYWDEEAGPDQRMMIACRHSTGRRRTGEIIVPGSHWQRTFQHSHHHRGEPSDRRRRKISVPFRYTLGSSFIPIGSGLSLSL